MRSSPALTVSAGTLALCLCSAAPALADIDPAPLPVPAPTPTQLAPVTTSLDALVQQVTQLAGLSDPVPSTTPSASPTATPSGGAATPTGDRPHGHAAAAGPAPARPRPHRATTHRTRTGIVTRHLSRTWSLPALPDGTTVQHPVALPDRAPVTAPLPSAGSGPALLAAGALPHLGTGAQLPGDGNGKAPRTVLVALAAAAAVGLGVAHARLARPTG